MLKDGAMVIPGTSAYDPDYYAIKIERAHLGVPVSLYLDELKGKKLKKQKKEKNRKKKKKLEKEKKLRKNQQLMVMILNL